MLIIGDTSATTGASKRVVMSESSLLAMAETDVADLGITPRSVIAIDRWNIPGIQKMYWARVSGAKVAIYPGHEKISLRHFLLEQKVTHLSTLWTTVRWLCGGLYKFPLIEVVEGGGEMGDWRDVELARQCFPNATIINRYATMETRVICRKHIGSKESGVRSQESGRLPVGWPVREVEIVSPAAGQEDEIVVRSPYLSDGYYNDPELTAVKFRNGSYYTGDIGYWLPNGELMHCVRMEMQVRSKESVVSSDAESYLHERNLKSALMGGEVK